MSRVRWREGDPEVRARVEAWLTGDVPGKTIAQSDRRQLVRIEPETPDGVDILAKRFALRSGRHPIRERLKAWVGRSPARREWRALRRLGGAGVAVPEPLGRARLANGDDLLVRRYVRGRPLQEALEAGPADRRRALRQIGRLVASVAEAGMVHRDLHVGNVLVGEQGPVLLDLQRATRSRRGLLRELGALDFSLSRRGLSAADRRRVVRAALPHDADEAAFDTIARHAEQAARRHYQSRTRRSLRPGRRFARVDGSAGAGLRAVAFSEADLDAALAAHREAIASGSPDVLKLDDRTLITKVATGRRRIVVKEVRKAGAARRLADGWRGAAARRAWVAGYGLAARDIPAATPLAFLEQRRFGLPTSSILVLEALEEIAPTIDDERADRLGRLLVALHARGVVHGDLKIGNILGVPAIVGSRPALIDLEGVRFVRRVSEADRIEGLAQLNASLADDLVSSPARLRIFRRYARALPFRDGEDRALERVVRRSLDREHVWRGRDCRCASQSRDTRTQQ